MELTRDEILVLEMLCLTQYSTLGLKEEQETALKLAIKLEEEWHRVL